MDCAGIIIKDAQDAVFSRYERAVGLMWGLSPKLVTGYTKQWSDLYCHTVCHLVRVLDNKQNVRKREWVKALALSIIAGALLSTLFNSLNQLTDTPHNGCYLTGEAVKGEARLQGYNDRKVEMAPIVTGIIKSQQQFPE